MSREWGDGEPHDAADELRMYAREANTERALKGKRGQAFLRKLEATLDEMPRQELSRGWKDGERVCLLATMLDPKTVEWADSHYNSTGRGVFNRVAEELGISPTTEAQREGATVGFRRPLQDGDQGVPHLLSGRVWSIGYTTVHISYIAEAWRVVERDAKPEHSSLRAIIDRVAAALGAAAARAEPVYICDLCRDTGLVPYETDTDDLDLLCHRCTAGRAEPEPERWSATGLWSGGIAKEWRASRGESSFLFRTVERARDCVAVGPSRTILTVRGEHCHEMAAARVVSALNSGELVP